MARRTVDRVRGLPSLEQSRETRRRALVLGKVRIREAAPQFWIWTVVLFCAFGVIYWHVSERQLQSQKSAVMARQRAISHELGPRLFPMREKLERWVMSLAQGSAEAVVDPALDLGLLSTTPGLYLRLLSKDARQPETLRRAAEHSLHDGFTSCMFVNQSASSAAAEQQCFSPAGCPPGQLCNEWNVCSLPTQPFNLRLMYRAFRVLESRWTDDLHAASGDYEVRLFERDLDKVAHTDVPIAINLVSLAKHFTVVLDEIPKTGIPEAPPRGEGEPAYRAEDSEALRVHGTSHLVRVAIWDLKTDRLLFRATEQAGASFIPLGRGRTPLSADAERARQRQVNSCSIAQAIRERVARSR